ncbi:MAG TPA: rod-binding protein [Bryobacteraceae bacterium]|jgi:Rod binding domain-containing protein|nr:rod-binding protein [Bryobacteraceae bacterium]
MSDSLAAPLLGTSIDLSTLLSPSTPKSGRDGPEAIAKAASQFEALLMGEIMKSTREADGSGWLGTDDDEAGSTMSDLSEQQLSQALAAGGGLGLAKMIAAGLTKTVSDRKLESTPAGTR